MSKIRPNDNTSFPTGSAVVATNNIATIYDRKLNTAYDMVMKLKKEIEQQNAEDVRLRNRELEEDLATAKTEKAYVKSWADEEIARLKETCAIEVSNAEAAMRAR
ncbi:unnamed protein product [Arabis nemorensis]|uniref:Uncharacterized protein n=1 Tax=Arabis nemorensis TaxID=586526 RepID=A0A565AXE4_9BRAS|nr:unnamed protein product [Arabis nemorensis]